MLTKRANSSPAAPDKARLTLLADLRALLGTDRDSVVFEEIYTRGIAADGSMGIEDVPTVDLHRALKAIKASQGEGK